MDIPRQGKIHGLLNHGPSLSGQEYRSNLQLSSFPKYTLLFISADQFIRILLKYVGFIVLFKNFSLSSSDEKLYVFLYIMFKYHLSYKHSSTSLNFKESKSLYTFKCHHVFVYPISPCSSKKRVNGRFNSGPTLYIEPA